MKSRIYRIIPRTTPALEPELDSEPTEIDIPLISHTPEADQEDTVENPSDLEETWLELKRGPGRPRRIKTGNRGRP